MIIDLRLGVLKKVIDPHVVSPVHLITKGGFKMEVKFEENKLLLSVNDTIYEADNEGVFKVSDKKK